MGNWCSTSQALPTNQDLCKHYGQIHSRSSIQGGVDGEERDKETSRLPLLPMHHDFLESFPSQESSLTVSNNQEDAYALLHIAHQYGSDQIIHHVCPHAFQSGMPCTVYTNLLTAMNNIYSLTPLHPSQLESLGIQLPHAALSSVKRSHDDPPSVGEYVTSYQDKGFQPPRLYLLQTLVLSKAHRAPPLSETMTHRTLPRFNPTLESSLLHRYDPNQVDDEYEDEDEESSSTLDATMKEPMQLDYFECIRLVFEFRVHTTQAKSIVSVVYNSENGGLDLTGPVKRLRATSFRDAVLEYMTWIGEHGRSVPSAPALKRDTSSSTGMIWPWTSAPSTTTSSSPSHRQLLVWNEVVKHEASQMQVRIRFQKLAPSVKAYKDILFNQQPCCTR